MSFLGGMPEYIMSIACFLLMLSSTWATVSHMGHPILDEVGFLLIQPLKRLFGGSSFLDEAGVFNHMRDYIYRVK